MALSPERVAAFRDDYRRETIPSGYGGHQNLATLTIICVAVIAAAAALIDSLTALELLAVPCAWMLANLAEYATHRWPMHDSRYGLVTLYRRHTGQHHRFFSFERMAIDEPKDLHVTLFTLRIALFFVGLLALPIAALAGWVMGMDVGLLVYAALVFYYLVYEWAHMCTHMPKDSALGRLPGVAAMRLHHGIHHDPKRMRSVNFNFAVPFGDWVFGTWSRDP